MSYRLDVEIFKERIGTFEKPHLLAITNGKDPGSVIVHVKYDDGSTYGKYLRYVSTRQQILQRVLTLY